MKRFILKIFPSTQNIYISLSCKFRFDIPVLIARYFCDMNLAPSLPSAGLRFLKSLDSLCMNLRRLYWWDNWLVHLDNGRRWLRGFFETMAVHMGGGHTLKKVYSDFQLAHILLQSAEKDFRRLHKNITKNLHEG